MPITIAFVTSVRAYELIFCVVYFYCHV